MSKNVKNTAHSDIHVKYVYLIKWCEYKQYSAISTIFCKYDYAGILHNHATGFLPSFFLLLHLQIDVVYAYLRESQESIKT